MLNGEQFATPANEVANGGNDDRQALKQTVMAKINGEAVERGYAAKSLVLPATYDKDWESEMIADAEAYRAHQHQLYLENLAIEKPDLLTKSKIEQIAGRFQTVKELCAGGYEPTGWIVNRLIPAESIVSLQGQAKSGKSTLVLHMVRELIRGGEFLGEKLEPAKVVYITEQNLKSFLSQVGSADIDLNTENLTVLTVEGTLGLHGWKDLFAVCEQQLLTTKAKLLVIDSWGRFTGITEEEENKSAPVQGRVTELRKIVTNTGSTILILHHVRKSGGGMIEAGMGSSALAQQVDVLLSLSGEPEQRDVPSKDLGGPESRIIQSKGRFSDVFNNQEIRWKKEEHRYVLVEMPSFGQSTIQKLVGLLPTQADEALDATELAAAYKAVHGEISPRTVENYFADLKKDQSVRLLEASGVKGNPAKLYRVE